MKTKLKNISLVCFCIRVEDSCSKSEQMDRSTRELLVRSIFFSIQKNNFKQKVKDEPSRKWKKKKMISPRK
jgi:hypothetical protein